MELTTLRYFIAVARELHFRRAAKLLHISQAPLSQQIIRLEEELGVRLFERTSRVVTLTEAGRLFRREAEAILEKAEQARRKMRDFAVGRCGRLSIGYNEPALNTVLPEALFRFRREFPEVELHLAEMETEAQLDALRSGRIDIGFLRPYGHDLSEFQGDFVFAEEYVLAIGENHALAGGGTVEPEMLDGVELLLFDRSVNPALFDEINAVFRHRGVFPLIRQYARNKNSMLALARAGLGVALLPESCTRDGRSGLRFRRLPPIFPRVELYAVRAPSSTPSVNDNFIRILNASRLDLKTK